MMNENDAIDLLKKTEDIAIDVWISGGWGIDALNGKQTRPHNDIDIFIQKQDAAAFLKMLTLNGYGEVKMDYTTDDHTVWCDNLDRTIDLHLFEFVDKKTLRYQNEIYPADVFNGKGKIGEISVRCLTAEAQLLFHEGYEHTEKDLHDVLLLCETFGLQLPEKYINQENHNIHSKSQFRQ